MKFAEQLGSNLAYCRRRAGLSQEELSFRASIHPTNVGMIECGKRMPKVDTVVKLAGALGIPTEELLDGLTWSPAGYEPGEFTELSD
jgi:transcriptional regulator with XRE-family HTH domain